MQKHASTSGLGLRLLSALAARIETIAKVEKSRTTPQAAVTKSATPALTPAQVAACRAVRLEMQMDEGHLAPEFFATRARDAMARKAAGITTPDVASAPNRMKAPYEDAAQAVRRLNRPESDYEARLREATNRQAAATQQLKDMFAGMQPAPSTGPSAL